MMQHGAHFRNAGCAHLPRHYACREPPFAIEDDVVGHGSGGRFNSHSGMASYIIDTTIPFFESPPRDGLVFFVKIFICAYNVYFVLFFLFCFGLVWFVLFCFVLFCFVCLFVSSSIISDIVPKKATIFSNLR